MGKDNKKDYTEIKITLLKKDKEEIEKKAIKLGLSASAYSRMILYKVISGDIWRNAPFLFHKYY